MPDIASQIGSGYFPPGKTPDAPAVVAAIAPGAVDRTIRQPDPTSPAPLPYPADIIAAPVLPAVAPAGSTGGNGPAGYSAGLRRNTRQGMVGGGIAGSSLVRPPGSWTGLGPYQPPYGVPVGSGTPPAATVAPVTVFDETLAGAVNGANTVFSVAHPVLAGSLQLYLNGSRQRPSAYTVAGTSVTLVDTPQVADDLACSYNY